MDQQQLNRQLQALHDKVCARANAPMEQDFYDDCAADAAAILQAAENPEQARHAIEGIGQIFDEVGVDAQRLLSSGQRRPLQVS